MDDKKLYQYTEDFAQLLQYLEDNEDLTYEDLKDTIDSIQSSAEEKIKNTGKVIKKLEDNVKTMKDHRERITEMIIKENKNIENLKEYLLYHMTQLNLKKVEDTTIKVSTRNSKSMVIHDESKLPKEYVKEEVTVKPDKAGFKKYYSELSEEDQAKIDYAYLAENQSIQIK